MLTNSCYLYYPLKVRYHFLPPYQTGGETIVFHILISLRLKVDGMITHFELKAETAAKSCVSSNSSDLFHETLSFEISHYHG
jgi:hypothetical protein